MDDSMDDTIQEKEALMASLANISDETKSQCRLIVLELFSDMDPDHLSRACEQGHWNPEDIISQVVNDMEDGKPYPKIQKASLKRKREDDEEDASSPQKAAKKWDNVGRRAQFRDAKSSYIRMRSVLLPNTTHHLTYPLAHALAVHTDSSQSLHSAAVLSPNVRGEFEVFYDTEWWHSLPYVSAFEQGHGGRR